MELDMAASYVERQWPGAAAGAHHLLYARESPEQSPVFSMTALEYVDTRS
jgi:hypothetical protein